VGSVRACFPLLNKSGPGSELGLAMLTCRAYCLASFLAPCGTAPASSPQAEFAQGGMDICGCESVGATCPKGSSMGPIPLM